MADPTSLGVIDEFVVTFTRYIDSGFGLLGSEVHYLTAILIGKEGDVCRRIRAHHHKFLKSCECHFQQLWRPWSQSNCNDNDGR